MLQIRFGYFIKLSPYKAVEYIQKQFIYFFFLKFRKSLIRLQLFNKALQLLLENQKHFKA
jgi:hypothetical protein